MCAALIVILSIYIINIIAILALVFFEKGDLPNAILWIIVLLFLPIVGFIIYFIFGSTYKPKILSMKYSPKQIEEKYKSIIGDVKELLEGDFKIKGNEDLIRFNSNNPLGIITGNNSLKVFNDAKDKFSDLFVDIENAKESINLEYFEFQSQDDIGKKLIELLEKKAEQGVKVKIIYDRIGSNRTSYSDFADLIKKGGEVQIFLPSLFKTFITINYRLHRKIAVIDNIIAYTGGINIGDEFLGRNKKVSPWRDTTVRIIGDMVSVLQIRFLIDWQYLLVLNNIYVDKIDVEEIVKIQREYSKKLGEDKMLIQFLTDGPDCRFRYGRDNYAKIILNSKKYVYMQTPYLAPDETVLNAIRIASQSGVDVRIIIPGAPDKKFVYQVTMSYAKELVRYGVKIYLYNEFIHSKCIFSDDNISLIGTTNMDERAFRLNYENDIVIYDEKLTKENKEQFERDMENCTELTPEDLVNESICCKIKQAIIRIVTPFI